MKKVQIELTENDIELFKDLVNKHIKEVIWEFECEITGEPVSIRLIKEEQENED